MPRYNHLIDVAFQVVSTEEDAAKVNKADLLSALLTRISAIVSEEDWEAFGYCDTYQEEEERNANESHIA